ncbi:MAG: hypothetical protein HY074_00690 [Deltaproteobacteria bacterium]|nr:hypothetical protein [Deltaproteobacteria bacterium]
MTILFHVLFAPLLVLSAWAQGAPDSRVFRFEHGAREFSYFAARHLLISSDCQVASGGKLSCMAAQAFERSSLVGIPLPRGGADPGAVICVKKFKAQVEVGLNSLGAAASFCCFADKSLVSTGSLDYAANH